MKKHEKTYHEGAQDERDAVRRKVRRVLKELTGTGTHAWPILKTLEAWISKRTERYRKRKGGL